jgi:hypothetical protein
MQDTCSLCCRNSFVQVWSLLELEAAISAAFLLGTNLTLPMQNTNLNYSHTLPLADQAGDSYELVTFLKKP